MRASQPSIGVVLPTFNCGPLLEPHLEGMQGWLDAAHEVVVVDSQSTDGTRQLLEKRLRHPRLQIHDRPRGLYQAWNFALTQLGTTYAYVSTVGESVSREGLTHLGEVAERFQCDVVISKPQFLDEQAQPTPDKRWPVLDICRTLNITEAVSLEGLALYAFAVTNYNDAYLGSSASNLYRTSVLQKHPFPTDYGTVGDGAWGLMRALDIRVGVTPKVFSTFREHPKAYSRDTYKVNQLSQKLLNLAIQTYATRAAADTEWRQQAEALGVPRLIELVRDRFLWQTRLETARESLWPWVLNPLAWQARRRRTSCEREMRALRKAILDQLFGQPSAQ